MPNLVPFAPDKSFFLIPCFPNDILFRRLCLLRVPQLIPQSGSLAFLVLSFSFSLALLFLFPCQESHAFNAQLRPKILYPLSSLHQIVASDQMTILTTNNANSYYIYREQEMGFEYDLAQAFAQRLGVSLQVRTPGWSQLIPSVHKKSGRFIAAGMTITQDRRELVDFSIPYMDVQQMVIVHKDEHSIQSQEDLHNMIIHVRKHTSYQRRLQELQEEGIEVQVKVHNNVPTEEFIRMVARKDIPATVADSNIAQLNRRYYPDVRIAFPISEKQSLGWAVRKQDQALLHAINDFLVSAQNDGTFARIFQKYYANVAIFDYLDLKKFHQRIKTRLPRYEAMIKKQASEFGFDWRLIAAVVYQESHFDPQATSYTGVQGLMQVTLDTAREMGISNRLDPKQSIHAGVKYLFRLYGRFEGITNQEQRLRFALASYNVGYGHVRDAQRLAQKQGLDPNKWSSLLTTLPLLRQPQYYTQTRYGYARGTEPVRYVKRIFSYYDILRQKAESSASTAQLEPGLEKVSPE